jgi:hypothetical protein
MLDSGSGSSNKLLCTGMACRPRSPRVQTSGWLPRSYCTYIPRYLAYRYNRRGIFNIETSCSRKHPSRPSRFSSFDGGLCLAYCAQLNLRAPTITASLFVQTANLVWGQRMLPPALTSPAHTYCDILQNPSAESHGKLDLL